MEKKKCVGCNKAKYLSEFHVKRTGCSDTRARCKRCRSTDAKLYARTIKGLTGKLYATQLGSSRERNHKRPAYTLKEFRKWVTSQPNFSKLYSTWVSSGYLMRLRPSPDRLDNNIGYTFDNLRLVTWEENADKNNRDRRSGIGTDTCKAVIQFTKAGKFVAEFHSVSHAARELGLDNSHIASCCRGEERNKSAGGFIWKFKTT